MGRESLVARSQTEPASRGGRCKGVGQLDHEGLTLYRTNARFISPTVSAQFPSNYQIISLLTSTFGSWQVDSVVRNKIHFWRDEDISLLVVQFCFYPRKGRGRFWPEEEVCKER